MLRLHDVVSQAKANTLRCRRIEHIVGTEGFRALFEVASDYDKERLNGILESGSELQLREWMERVRKKDYNRMAVRELRKLAALRSVPDYHILRKDELVNELRTLDRLAADTIAAQGNAVSRGGITDGDNEGVRVGCDSESQCPSGPGDVAAREAVSSQTGGVERG